MADEAARAAPPEWRNALAEAQPDLAAADGSPLPEAIARLAAVPNALKAEQSRRPLPDCLQLSRQLEHAHCLGFRIEPKSLFAIIDNEPPGGLHVRAGMVEPAL